MITPQQSEEGWTDTQWPDWSDCGKLVEIVDDQGNAASGELIVDDVFVIDDDEVPIFALETDGGNLVSFASHKRWRFAPIHTKEQS